MNDIHPFISFIYSEARKKAIGMYRILAIIQVLLGVGLLICGGFGTTYDDEGFGPPFFLGGFLVGSMVCILTEITKEIYMPLYLQCTVWSEIAGSFSAS